MQALGVLFYNIFLFLFKIGIYIASLFNEKARKWVRGRKDLMHRLQESIGQTQGLIWMHCASLGEFEQGRPLLESIRKNWPNRKILLTFFSPSGYEVRKNYEGADWVYFLPLDGAVNARRFLEITRPALVIFVKYEFWYYYLKKIKYRNIPLILVSAYFRRDMSFFKWYGTLQRKMLSRFDQLFVQNQQSKVLLRAIGLDKICTVTGDTRFDRVISISEKFEPIPHLDRFIGDARLVVAGSTWPGDEEVLKEALNDLFENNVKLVIAPHEINEEHLADIEELFPSSKRYSKISQEELRAANVLIIDNIGMLARLYKYSMFSFIGGGFAKTGIHNVLEAAVYGKPVFFGPNYGKYREAVDLVTLGGAIPVNNGTELKSKIQNLLSDTREYQRKSSVSHEYVWVNKGATEKIIRFIQEKRLLTS